MTLIWLLEQNKSYIKDSTSSGIVHYCYAKKPGASPTAAVWQIYSESTAGSIVTRKRADGNDKYDNIAADRYTITYS